MIFRITNFTTEVAVAAVAIPAGVIYLISKWLIYRDGKTAEWLSEIQSSSAALDEYFEQMRREQDALWLANEEDMWLDDQIQRDPSILDFYYELGQLPVAEPKRTVS